MRHVSKRKIKKKPEQRIKIETINIFNCNRLLNIIQVSRYNQVHHLKEEKKKE